ncbi:plasmid partitioning protein (plasmid) [Sinorhizobium meliloti Rm41]|nr:plasmid partitioning protein [Sinorhizobium meliloti Rm41]
MIDGDGKLSFDIDTLRVAARSMLVEVLSCRRGMSNSGIVSRIAGLAIGADSYLPNMGTEDFLLCLSRQALEASCKGTSVLPRPRVRETRAALVEHFREGHFVHPAALFAPDPRDLAELIKQGEVVEEEDVVDSGKSTDGLEGALAAGSAAGDTADLDVNDPEADDGAPGEDETAYGIAAE